MSLVERLIGTLAPHNCLNCGQEGTLLCRWCLPDSCPPLPAQCYRCHRLSPDSRVCARCRSRTPLGYVWLRAEYDGLAKQLIYELKFGRNQAAAAVIAELMRDSLPYVLPDTLIVHIPTSTVHVRQRGYDQAQRIAAELARQLGRRHLPLLARLGQIKQVGSSRQKRLTQLQGAFRPCQAALIKGTHILLIDDVLTTGATLSEAARTLKHAGAKRVDAAVFARSQ